MFRPTCEGTRYLPIGPFTFRIASNCHQMLADLERLYQGYPALDSNQFVDFQITVNMPEGLRRYLRPQVNFSLDEAMPFKPLPRSQAYAMLEWGMNWCIATRAHQFLIFHAGVIEKNDKVILMPGIQGAGKSTLTAAMVYQGWRLFSDELALISLADSLVYPCTRPINLKNGSIDIIDDYVKDAVFSSIAKDTHKGTVALLRPPLESVQRMHEPAALHAIVFPRYVAGVEAQLTGIDRLDAFEELLGHSFNYNVLGAEAFTVLSQLIREVDCYRLEYSNFDQAQAMLTEVVG